ITDFGVFIGIEEGIDGLIHVSDLSWTERIKHPSEKYAKGESIQAVVLKIDKENERFSLGVKQLEPDPWQAAVSNYPSGSLVEGKITNITDFGVFVQLEEGIEGLVHVSEISREKIKTPVGMFNVGDILKTAVINVSAADRKIGLSLKALEEDGGEEGGGSTATGGEDAAQKQQGAATKTSGPSTFGDLLKAAAGTEEEGSTDN
ncbi:MAG: S1 RNA-binding domain-containing protein, partial [Candidatus Electrothrix sp. ATG1]|nr:S1 RNA-binding domain-containing protein [Candidatus Electrothrix sp. ATG1]